MSTWQECGWLDYGICLENGELPLLIQIIVIVNHKEMLMSRVRVFCFLCSLNKLDIWTNTQHECSVAHTGACVVVIVVFCVFFTLLHLVFSNVCFEFDIILMFFVVNEIEHGGKQDKGYDKLQTKCICHN